MTKWCKSKGFTLIELMIVVAIIAILAAIAIPNYLRYAMKSKTAEATTNLGAIRTGEEAYYAENDLYRDCDPTPADFTADSTPDDWMLGYVQADGTDGVDDFADIGFEPDGWVRYRYTAVAAPGTPDNFSATATSDLDEDGIPAIYTINTADPSFPRAILQTPGTY